MPYVTEDNLSDVVLAHWKDIPDARLQQIMESLIKHPHGFVRDIEPPQAEFATAIGWLTRTGKQCSQKRQEFMLVSAVLGVDTLVDAINHRHSSGATPSTVEGPFHVPSAPPVEHGGNIGQRLARAFHASSPVRSRDSTGSRSRMRCLTFGRPMGRGDGGDGVLRSEVRLRSGEAGGRADLKLSA
jgi:Catechol dioxygenase N terminus